MVAKALLGRPAAVVRGVRRRPAADGIPPQSPGVCLGT